MPPKKLKDPTQTADIPVEPVIVAGPAEGTSKAQRKRNASELNLDPPAAKNRKKGSNPQKCPVTPAHKVKQNLAGLFNESEETTKGPNNSARSPEDCEMPEAEGDAIEEERVVASALLDCASGGQGAASCRSPVLKSLNSEVCGSDATKCTGQRNDGVDPSASGAPQMTAIGAQEMSDSIRADTLGDLGPLSPPPIRPSEASVSQKVSFRS